MRYGFKASLPLILWTPSMFDMTWNDESAATLQYVGLAVSSWCFSVLSSYLVETAAARFSVPERLILGVNFILGTLNIVVPCALVWHFNAAPGANMLYLLQSVIIWMKLISYAHANRGLRRSSRRAKKADLQDSAKSASISSSGSKGNRLLLYSLT
jgi:hypothetical protein